MTIPKQTTTDTLLPYTTWDSAGNITSHTYPIKAGSHVIIDSPASQRNPFYWSDPSTFNPRRHLGEKGSETSSGYTGFSMGSRACIGKRFAEVEMVAFLSHVVKMFRLYPVEKFQGESKDETKLRMEHGSEELTFTPGNFDLRFERRH
jgi:cytochrome P450